MTTTTLTQNEEAHPAAAGEAENAARSLPARAPWQRIDWIILLALLLLGGAFRFYHLGITPPGFQFDEAFNAIDAEQVLQGNRPLFLPANGGREVLYSYFQAGLIAVFGSSAWSFRLASALWGTAAIGAAYILFRTMLRRDSRLIAALTAAALVISYWHIHFSHFGIRVITMPVIFSLLFGAFFAATQATTRTRRLLFYALAGVALGVSVWSNPTGRFAPIILIAWVAILLWRNPAQRTLRLDGPIVGLLIAGALALLIFLPLGITFWQNPDFFFGHAAEVSVFADRVSGDRGPLLALADNILHVMGMFSFFGDREWTHGIPGRPILDWVIAVPFYIGVVIWVMRLLARNRKRDPDGDALWLLALWVVVMLAPSILSDAAPNYSRSLPALPAALLPVGLGLAWIIRRPWRPAWIGYALAAAILIASATWSAYDYFVRFPQMQAAYYAYDVDKADALTILRERGVEGQVYLSPLWAEHAPVRWMRGGSSIKTLEPALTLALPAAKSAIYAYTGEEGARAQALAERINGMLAGSGVTTTITVDEIRDKYDKPLLWLVTVPPALVSELALAPIPSASDRSSEAPPAQIASQLPTASVRFDDAPALLGAQMDAQGAVTLEWQAEQTTLRDLTAFVHYVDRDGNRVAQADRIPGDGSYATPFWSAGDRVIDRLAPDTFAPCTSGEEVRVLTGWYEYAADGARRPRLGAPGDLADAGAFTLPMRPLDESEVEPQTRLDPPHAMGPLTLLGYTMHDVADLHPRTPFVMDIYYRVDQPVEPIGAQLEYRNDALSVNFGEFPLPAHPVEEAGSVYCQRVRLQVPQQVEVQGEMADWNEVGEINPVISLNFTLPVDPAMPTASSPSLTTLHVRPLLPNDATNAPLATFAGEIKIDSVEVGDPLGETQPVTITWQATSLPAYPYTTFVQLLTPDGAFVTGSDVQPTLATQKWTPGIPYSTEHMLALPPDLPAGEYQLVGGMYDTLTLERLAAFDANGASLADNLAQLGTVTLGG